MALPQVGLEAVIENLAGFSKGASVITKAYDDIDASSDKVAKSSSKLDGIFSKVGGGLMSFGKLAAGAALGGVAILGTGLVALGTKSVLAAADVGEMQSLFNTAFGQDAPKAREEIDAFAAAVGRNKFELEGFAGGIKSLVTPMGLTGDTANEMSIGFSKLAVDLSSFYNVTESDALESLRSGLIGETEPLRKFGVVLNEAAIKAKAMELGLIEMTVDSGKLEKAQGSITKAQLAYNKAVEKFGPESDQAKVAQINLTDAQNRLNDVMAGSPADLNAAQKAQATYALIMEQTALAQGDATRTSGSWVNQTRALKSVIDETVVSIGMELLPVVTPLLAKFTEMVRGVLPKVVDLFKSIINVVSSLASTFASNFLDEAGNDFGFLGQIIYGIEDTLSTFFDLSENVTMALYDFDTAILMLAQKISGEFQGSAIDLGSILKNVVGAAFNFLIDVVLPALTTAIMFVVDNWDTFKAAIVNAVNTVKSIAIPIFEFIGDLIVDYVVPAIQEIVRWFRKDLPVGVTKTQAALKPIIDKILPQLVDIFNIIYKWTVKNWPLIQKTIITVMRVVQDEIKAVTKAIIYVWENWGDEIMAVVMFVFKAVKVNLQNMLDVVTLIMQLITGDWAGAWKTIQDIADRSAKLIYDLIKTSFNNMLKIITDIMTSIKNKISEIWSSIVSAVKDKVNEVYNAIKSKFDTFASLISGYASKLLSAAKDMMQGVINGITQSLSSISSALTSTLTSAINTLKNAITSGSLASILVSAGQSIINKIKDGIAAITDLASRLIAKVQEAINNLSSAISSGTLYSVLSQIGRNIMNKIIEGVNAVTNLASQLIAKVQSAINSLSASSIFNSLYTVGRDIVNGIIDGVESMGTNLAGALQDIVDAAIEAIKDQLGIGSPSKVFYGVGLDMMKGLQAGISSLAPAINTQLQAAVTGPAVNAPSLGATGTTNIYNSYSLGGNTINSGMDAAQFETRVLRVIRKNL